MQNLFTSNKYGFKLKDLTEINAFLLFSLYIKLSSESSYPLIPNREKFPMLGIERSAVTLAVLDFTT